MRQNPAKPLCLGGFCGRGRQTKPVVLRAVSSVSSANRVQREGPVERKREAECERVHDSTGGSRVSALAPSTPSLELLAQARAAVERVTSVDDAKSIRDKAEALRAYAKQAGEGLAIQNECAEIKIRAERRAGELLKATPKRTGGAAMRARYHDDPAVPPTLDEIGISRSQSSRWQTMAKLPEEQFEEHIAEVRDAGAELSSAGVLRAAKGQKLAVHTSSATPEWGTPPDLFDELDREFNFTLDVCATPDLAKCADFFTPEQDGLSQEWTGVCWMSPPYGETIGHWMAKASESAAAGALVVCLVPARTDTGWWWDHCINGEIRFLRGRLKFDGAESSAPFPSAVVILGRPPSVVWWER
jgi:phage N-6-adenine-methyltransferase